MSGYLNAALGKAVKMMQERVKETGFREAAPQSTHISRSSFLQMVCWAVLQYIMYTGLIEFYSHKAEKPGTKASPNGVKWNVALIPRPTCVATGGEHHHKLEEMFSLLTRHRGYSSCGHTQKNIQARIDSRHPFKEGPALQPGTVAT